MTNYPNNLSSTDSQGQEFLIPYLDRPWDPLDITIQDIKKYEPDFFLQNVFLKLQNFVFLGPASFNMMDRSGKEREDIAEWIREMIRNVDLMDFMKFIFYDLCFWGNALHSDGLAEDDKHHLVYEELRILPPELFAYPGGALVVPYMWGNYVMNPNYTYGRLLKGIERHDDDTIHYWQRMKYQIIELGNCKHIKSPVHSHFIDGIPLFNPLYKLLPRIYFALDQLMMHNNRSNMLFLTIDDKSSGAMLPDQKTSKWEYSKQVLKSASNKQSFPLPAGVIPTEFRAPISDIHIKTIDLLTKWLISFITPADIISKGDGSLIGGSSNFEAQLFKMFSESIQGYIEREIEKILDYILEINGFAKLGIHSEVKMKKLAFDNEELDFKIGREILKSVKEGKVIGDVNEVREKFRLENADVEFLTESKKEWEAITIEQVPLLRESLSGTAKELDASAQEMVKKEQPAIKQTEEELKQDIKGNQAFMPSLEDHQKDLEKKLQTAFAALYEAIEA